MRIFYHKKVYLFFSFLLLITTHTIPQTGSKDIQYGSYLKASLLGTLAVIPPTIFVGRTYFSEEACRERGVECNPFHTGPRLISIAFTIGSSTGMWFHARNKWKVFTFSIVINAIPISLMYNSDHLFLNYLLFYFPVIPFVSAFIGYETDRLFSRKLPKKNGLTFVPQLLITKGRFATGISLLF